MPKFTAKTACKHTLYEKSVQCVGADIDFVIRIFKNEFSRQPRILKEDFCGTFSAAIEFINRNRQNFAIAVDLDKDVLTWGKQHNLPQAKRKENITIINDDVNNVTEPKIDIIMSMNFSYFIFKKREELKQYFKNVFTSLKTEGAFVLDIYGGSEAQEQQEEKTEFDDFTYVWDQGDFNPITNEVKNHIHFEFPDGSKIKKAFSYDWRLWTPQEIVELLQEVGFATADVYWEGWDEEEETGNGIFRKRKKAESIAGWIAYIVGIKK